MSQDVNIAVKYLIVIDTDQRVKTDQPEPIDLVAVGSTLNKILGVPTTTDIDPYTHTWKFSGEN